MGLLDTIQGRSAAALPRCRRLRGIRLLSEAVGLLGNSQAGGLSGLLDKFERRPWKPRRRMGGHRPKPTGHGRYIQAALGSPQIEQIAARLGIPPQRAASGWRILPHLVDHLTPSGGLSPADQRPRALVCSRASCSPAHERGCDTPTTSFSIPVSVVHSA